MSDTNSPVALVTGASSGIGEAIAMELNKAGYTVYAAARRTERLAHLEELGMRSLSLDVTDEVSIQKALQTIESESGKLDVLINNAGYGSYGSIEDVSMDEARKQMDVNLFGLARMMQLVTPQMRAAGSGQIVNIASIGSRFSEPLGAWYHASKYAVEGLSDAARIELAPFGIKVITVHPGLIASEWAGIAADNLEKTSANGAYAQAARRKAQSLRTVYAGKLVSPPEVVAKGIIKVLSKANPKFRYAIGGGARTILFLRRFTSDRIFYGLLNR